MHPSIHPSIHTYVHTYTAHAPHHHSIHGNHRFSMWRSQCDDEWDISHGDVGESEHCVCQYATHGVTDEDEWLVISSRHVHTRRMHQCCALIYHRDITATRMSRKNIPLTATRMSRTMPCLHARTTSRPYFALRYDITRPTYAVCRCNTRPDSAARCS